MSDFCLGFPGDERRDRGGMGDGVNMAESTDGEAHRDDTNSPVPPLEYASPLKRFLHHDIVGSGLLLVGVIAALLIANSPWADDYHHFWEIEFGFAFGEFDLLKPLHLWVNDGLMALFFFMVGLEIKRELLAGELASREKAMLPVMAAIGGMVVPAMIYWVINRQGDGANGWGVPMATDIAFAAGCIAVLKKRVPTALMVFLVALAIVDDLGAVTVIALFYTDEIAQGPLFMGIALIGFSAALSWLGVRRTLPYVVIGMMVWVAFLGSGVHATVAGVLLAFTIPSNARYKSRLFEDRVRELLARFMRAEEQREQDPEQVTQVAGKLLVSPRQQDLIRAMTTECHHVEAPLQRIEYNIEPFCVFIVMPVFAFANSGLSIDFATLGDVLMTPVAIGVFLGLIVGKQVGVMLGAYLSVKIGLARLPHGVKWSQIYAVSWLAGIGFTMSVFIAELAFPVAEHSSNLAEAKVSIFLASLIAAVTGLILLRLTSPLLPADADEDDAYATD
ncbi:MAG: Na+/H+ antiporter NhaA [Candidatus Hydrogenedentes bacterium]|nr:Na+/H+ antiporter NhaA [Candidatus Hydrogenedentota bacterium]